MSATKSILVCGATGKQGGSLIKSLLASQSTHPFHIVALTRNTQSSRAQELAKKPNVSVLQGDLDDVPAIFQKAREPFYGVFSVQVPLKPKVEEAQGKALVDGALANGVRHFVYASVDRGGAKSDDNPTPIAHFISKHNIEKHLFSAVQASPSKMDWTVIRPVAFMDNLTPGFFGRVFGSAWSTMSSKIQLAATEDIGFIAAEAFKNPDEFKNQAFSFASDELSFEEGNEIFKKMNGTDMPMTYGVLARTVFWVFSEQVGVMFKWIGEGGFDAKPQEWRSRYPQLKTFEKWLETSSSWKKS